MSIFGKIRLWADRCLRWMMPSIERDMDILRAEVDRVRELRYEQALIIAQAGHNGRKFHRAPLEFTYLNRQAQED